MKPAFYAIAVLAAFAGAASAQSSVTLFGNVDLAGRYVKADGQPRRLSQAASGLNSSQLAIRGIEDLGDGLKAGFTLASEVLADTGTAGVGGKFWNRRSTVSLFNRMGEIRLGRDYVPTFWTQGVFDAFGIVGLGSSGNVRQLYGGTRIDNSIGYFLPSDIGGLYGQAMVAAAEGGATLDRPGRYVGGRFGYAVGSFDVAVAVSQLRFAAPFGAGSNGVGPAVAAVAGDTQKTYNVGASWDFGFAKLMGYYDRETLGGVRENMGSVSAVIPFGQSEVHVGYDRSTLRPTGASSTSVDQVKASYVYNLSKRTALYALATRLDNKNATKVTLPGAAGATVAGGKSQGLDFGIRHFF